MLVLVAEPGTGGRPFGVFVLVLVAPLGVDAGPRSGVVASIVEGCCWGVPPAPPWSGRRAGALLSMGVVVAPEPGEEEGADGAGAGAGAGVELRGDDPSP